MDAFLLGHSVEGLYLHIKRCWPDYDCILPQLTIMELLICTTESFSSPLRVVDLGAPTDDKFKRMRT